jgi:hypothetical protein
MGLGKRQHVPGFCEADLSMAIGDSVWQTKLNSSKSELTHTGILTAVLLWPDLTQGYANLLIGKGAGFRSLLDRI